MLTPLYGALPPLGLSRNVVVANGLLNNLVAYWALDEAGGANNALDKHTNGLTLTQVSSPGSAAGKVYAAARTFDGSSDYFYRAPGTTLQLGDIDFAVAAWIYCVGTLSASDTIVGQYIAAPNLAWKLMVTSAGTARLLVSSNGTITTNAGGSALAANAWQLIVAWRDATANKIYVQVNGGTPVETAYNKGVFVSDDNFSIGASGDGASKFRNQIGPIAFWKNRTLDATARAALWNSGAGLAYESFTT